MVDLLTYAPQLAGADGLELPNEKRTFTATISGAPGWILTYTGNWFTIEKIANADGTTTVNFHILGSTTSKSTGTLTLTEADGTVHTLKIYQQADTTFTLTHEGSDGTVTDVFSKVNGDGLELSNSVGSVDWKATGVKSIVASGSWFTLSQTNLGNGSFDLTVSVKDYTLTQNTGTIEFTLLDNSKKTLTVFQKAHNLSGTVTDGTNPVSGASVVVSNNLGFRADPVITGEDGRFSVPVYDAWYSITVTHENYNSKELTSSISVSMKDVDAGEIALDSSPYVTGRVLDETGNPVSGVAVECGPYGYGYNGSKVVATTGEDGRFRFSTEAASGKAIRLIKDGYPAGFTMVSVTEGAVTDTGDLPLLSKASLATGYGIETQAIGYCGDAAMWAVCRKAGTTDPLSLIIAGEGETWMNTNKLWMDYAESIASIQVKEGITVLNGAAFDTMPELESIALPSSLTSIGSVFHRCYALHQITVDPTNPYYSSVDGVLFNKDETVLCVYPQGRADTTYEIPEGTQQIGWGAFNDCGELVNLIVPESVTSLNTSFASCKGLRRIYCFGDLPWLYQDQNVTYYYLEGKEGWASPTVTDNNGKTYNTAVFDPDDVDFGVYLEAEGTCGENVTWELDSTRTLTIRGTGPMYDYDNSHDSPIYPHSAEFEKLVVEEGVTSLGKNAFNSCYALTTMSLPDSLKSIGVSAFENCSALKKMVIPGGVTTIGLDAFRYCSNLAAFEVMPENASFEAEDGVLFTKNKVTLLKYPEGKGDISVEADWHYVIPDGVQRVESGAFSEAMSYNGGEPIVWDDGHVSYSGLISLTFPASVQEIEWQDYCSNYRYTKDLYFLGTAPADMNGYGLMPTTEAKSVIHFLSTKTSSEYYGVSGWSSSIWISPDNYRYKTVCDDAQVTASGFVKDGVGTPVENVEIRLYDYRRRPQPVYALTGSDGGYAFQLAAAGTYILEAEKDGYATWSKTLTISAPTMEFDTIVLS